MASDPPDPAGAQLSPVRARSFMAAAAAARALLEAMLAEPVPAGRRRTATATTRARMVLAVVYLTLGYSKTADRFTMPQLEELTGYPARTIGRFLGQLAERGWFDYRPASNHHSRPLNQVQLRPADTTTVPASPGRSQDLEPVDLVTAAARHLIETVLHQRQPLATLRVTAVLLADLVTWLHTQGSIDSTAIAFRTHLDRKTVGRKLQALAQLGVLDYQPGRGRGVHGTVRLQPPPDTSNVQPASRPASRRAGHPRRRVSPPLTTEQRDRANQFLGRVFMALERQEPGHGDQVKAALEQRLQNKDRLGQLVTAVLEAGGEHQLLQALTHSRNPDRGAYADAEDPPGALFRRVQNCHSELGLTLVATQATAEPGTALGRNAIAEMLRPGLEHTNQLDRGARPAGSGQR